MNAVDTNVLVYFVDMRGRRGRLNPSSLPIHSQTDRSRYPFFSIFAHVSRSDTVRLNTGRPGLLSTVSTEK